MKPILFALLGCLCCWLGVAEATPLTAGAITLPAAQEGDQPPPPRFTPIPRPRSIEQANIGGYRFEPAKPWRFGIYAQSQFVSDYDFILGVELELKRWFGRVGASIDAHYNRSEVGISFNDTAKADNIGIGVGLAFDFGGYDALPFWLEPYLDGRFGGERVDVSTGRGQHISPRGGADFWEGRIGGGFKFRPLEGSRFRIDLGTHYSAFGGFRDVGEVTRVLVSLGFEIPLGRVVDVWVAYNAMLVNSEEDILFNTFLDRGLENEAESVHDYLFNTDRLQVGVTFRF